MVIKLRMKVLNNRVRHLVRIHRRTDGSSDIGAQDLIGGLSTRGDRSFPVVRQDGRIHCE